jgi:hypothetical protein
VDRRREGLDPEIEAVLILDFDRDERFNMSRTGSRPEADLFRPIPPPEVDEVDPSQGLFPTAASTMRERSPAAATATIRMSRSQIVESALMK